MSKQPTPARRTKLGLLLIVLGIGTAIGGLIHWGVTVNAGEARYGSIDLPGQTVVNLPAGLVDLTFTMDLSNQTVAIPVLRMTVAPVDGGPGPVVDGRMGAALSDNGVTHIRVGRTGVTQAGQYRVSADGGVDASPNPRLLIGRRVNPFPTLLIILGIALVVLIIGIVVLVRSPVHKNA